VFRYFTPIFFYDICVIHLPTNCKMFLSSFFSFQNIGLRQLQVINGGVHISNNINLSFLKTIDLQYLQRNQRNQFSNEINLVTFFIWCNTMKTLVANYNNFLIRFQKNSKTFGYCSKCSSGNCWSKKSCQRTCPQCGREGCREGRSPSSRECCNSLCFGGCNYQNLSHRYLIRFFEIFIYK